MPISGRFFTSKELQDLLGVSRQRIADLAREHGWEFPRPGLYYADQVDEYLWARWRRQLFKEFGMAAKELVTDDTYDLMENCSVCQSFAIYRPATIDELTNPDLPVYADGWPWRCIKGHSSE